MPTHLTGPAEPPLLRPKISIPQIPSESLDRPRLVEQIHAGVEGPLTLLAAPAGFGKTHLLIAWTQETHLPVAWLTLDGEDNNPGRFLRYLVGALQVLEPGLGEDALDFAQSSKSGGLEVGLTLLINEISALPKEIALVLDDFQALDDPQVLQGVGFLLKYQPPNLHIIIASRSGLEQDLALLRARAQLVELGAEELRFTGDEVNEYLGAALGRQLPAETVRSLEERSNGWITPLKMAAISLKNQADPETLLANLQGKEHHLAGFLAEEVLDRQPGEIRQFLLKSSILETLTGPLCEAVVKPDAQPGYGAVMLARLEHANLFITALDEKHEWFRYHPLFANFLRQVLADIHPAEVPELHQRAALWFEQNGSLDQALRHALESGDVEWAADLIAHSAQAMIRTGEISELIHWIDRLPQATVHRRPRLALAYAWALIASYRLDQARFWLDDVERTLDRLDQQASAVPADDGPGRIERIEPDELSFVRGGLALCRSYLAMLSGDMDLSASLSQQASSSIEAEQQFYHQIYYRSILALEKSLSFILSGDTHKAIESLRETLRVARRANNPFVMIIAASSLADMQALQGQLNRAWETLQRVQYLFDPGFGWESTSRGRSGGYWPG